MPPTPTPDIHGPRNAELRWCLALLAVCLVGCGAEGGIPTYPAQGRVVFPDGSPAGEGSIVFESQEHSLAATGVVAQDGTFRLGTFTADDGAVAGAHVASFIPAEPEGSDPDANLLQAPQVDPRYMHPDTSGLHFEVLADSANEFDVIVRPPGGRP